MVDIIDAFSVLNKSVLNVLDDTVLLDQLDTSNMKKDSVRLEEAVTPIADIHERLDGTVIKCHRLNQYVNKFYSIHLDESEVCCIDFLININREDIDLTEFGDFV